MKIKINLTTNLFYLRSQRRSISIPEDKILDITYDDVKRFTMQERPEAEFLERYPFDPSTWTKGYKKLLWHAPLATANGFGYAGQETLLALDKALDVYTVSEDESIDMDHRFKELQVKNIGEPNCISVVLNVPLYPRKLNPSEICGIYTPFETTKISPKMAANINTYDFCLTTAKFLVKTFKDSGVKIPIYVVPHGVRHDIFTFKAREPRSNFTFGHYGTLQYRKGTDLVVEAFTRAFPIREYPDVRLNIKATFPDDAVKFIWWNSTDSRITTDTQKLTKERLVQRLHSWDCLLYPSRGEGFGLPIIEAMSTGLPVIVTGWSAMPDFVHHMRTGILLDYHLEQTTGYVPEDRPFLGEWAEPSLDDLVDKMQWVYNNQREAFAIGKVASDDVAKNWTWDIVAKKLIKSVNTYIKSKVY